MEIIEYPIDHLSLFFLFLVLALKTTTPTKKQSTTATEATSDEYVVEMLLSVFPCLPVSLVHIEIDEKYGLWIFRDAYNISLVCRPRSVCLSLSLSIYLSFLEIETINRNSHLSFLGYCQWHDDIRQMCKLVIVEANLIWNSFSCGREHLSIVVLRQFLGDDEKPVSNKTMSPPMSRNEYVIGEEMLRDEWEKENEESITDG